MKLVLEKAEEPEIKLPTSAGSSKKQESSRKTPISALYLISWFSLVVRRETCALSGKYNQVLYFCIKISFPMSGFGIFCVVLDVPGTVQRYRLLPQHSLFFWLKSHITCSSLYRKEGKLRNRQVINLIFSLNRTLVFLRIATDGPSRIQ